MLRQPTYEELKKLHFWRSSTFLVMLFGYIGYYLCRKNISAAFPLLADEFGFTNSELGVLALTSEIVYAIGKLINGPLGDKIGGRKIFLIGMFGAIISNVLFSFGQSMIFFIIAWCINRYFLSMGWGGLAKTIGRWYEPEKNGTVMGVISLNFQFGGVVATLFAGWLISIGVGWRGIFYYPALLLFIIFIWSYFFSKDKPSDVVKGVDFPRSEKTIISNFDSSGDEEGKIEPKKIIKGLLRLSIFRHLLLFSFLTTFLRSIFFFWTPKLLVDIGLGTTNAILKSAIFPLLGCLGTVFIGWYTDHHAKNGDRARMMWIMLSFLALSLGALSFLLLKGEENSNLIVLLLGACGFFLLGPYSMSSGALSLDIAGSKGAGSCTGMIDGLGYLGGALSVWMAGYLSDSLGWGQVFLVLFICSLISVFSAYMMSRTFQEIHLKKRGA